ncbi:Uncharacterized protein At4g04980 [Linum perenne]
MRNICTQGGRERSSSKREKYPVPRPKQMGRSRGGSTELFILMMDLRKKIIIFRDVFDLPPCDFSASINELVTETMTDLHNLHPEIMPMKELSDIKEEASIHEVLIYLCGALRSVGDSWVKSHEWMDKSTLYKQDNKDELNSEQLVELALATLNCLIKVAKEKSEEDDEDEDDDDEAEEEEEYMKHGVEKAKFLVRSYSESNATPFSTSPETPTSVLPGLKCPASPKAEEFTNLYCSSPLLRFLSVEAVGKLNRIDIKRLSFHLFPHHHGNQKSNVVNEDKMEESNKDEDDRDGRKDNEATSLVPPPPPPPPPSTARMQMKATPGENVAPPPPPPVLKTEEATISLSVLLSPPKTLLSEIPSASPPPPPMPPPPRNVSQGKEQPSSSMTTPKTAKQATPPSLVSSSNGPAAPPPPPPAPSSNGPTPPPPPPDSTSKEPTPPPPPPIPSSNGPAPPPPPSGSSSKGPAPPPPPPGSSSKGPPPPPPPGVGKMLWPRKGQSKLKRSSQMGNLYRALKGKVEGGNPTRAKNGRASPNSGNNNGGKQGMADALAEITKRSAYFQQIEEDVTTYAEDIAKLKTEISSFKTKDMAELVKFYHHVESILENLTDETQVLARFEGFPQKKLEAVRASASLYCKLKGIVTDLQTWKIEPPTDALLDRTERYVNKMKGDLDAFERTKDEECKKFKGHNIEFDLQVLVQIKEAVVDLSSNCMEMALKDSFAATILHQERKEAAKNGTQPSKSCCKTLWRAFQFAFRVYTFAGGHDDRADKLTRELAQQIEEDHRLMQENTQ